MIKTENLTINGKAFVRTYSDSGYYVHGGSPEGDYAEAIDPVELERTYIETDIPLEEQTEEDDELREKAEAFDILMGDN